jgi:hypothetical protein
MAADEILRSYGDASKKEDVLGLIEILTAKETSIHNQLGKTSASSTVHETLVDTQDTAASLAVAEGADFTNTALTTPTRLTNIVQEVKKRYSVTKIQRAIEKFQSQDEMARQRAKALVDWNNAVEYDLVRSTLVSGVSSATAAKMKGIIQAISKSTNYTSHNSGTVWSASILKGLMKTRWDNSNGDVATDMYMGSFLSDKTDDFTNKTGIQYDGVGLKTVVTAVDVFETGFGRLAKRNHRYIQVSGTDATGRVLFIRPEKLKVAYLIRPQILDMPSSGAYDAEAVYGAMTVEVRNQDSNAYADGFDID